MNIHSPGSDVRVVFDMIDMHTNEIITPVSAIYSVYDDAGTVLVLDAAVTVNGGESQLQVIVDAVDNVVTGINGARTVEMMITTATGTVSLTETYVLERLGFLAIPTQSGQTVPQSLMLSRQLAQAVLEVWGNVEDDQRRGALQEAWLRLSRLPYNPWHDYELVPDEVSDTVRYGQFHINELGIADWETLPAHFTNALKRAQLIEACVLLEGDPTWDRRQDGLISKTVGESSEMFSSRKSAISSISPKAHREIRGYLRRQIGLARG